VVGESASLVLDLHIPTVNHGIIGAYGDYHGALDSRESSKRVWQRMKRVERCVSEIREALCCRGWEGGRFSFLALMKWMN
jgi:hypothetical protein